MVRHRWGTGVHADSRYNLEVVLSFADKAVRRSCESQSHSERSFGANVASRLIQRLAELRAASTAADLPFGPVGERGEGKSTELLFRLGKKHWLVICANHVEPRMTKHGRVDWSRVTRIKVMGIEQSQ